MDNPFDQFDNSAGAVYGPPPKAPAPAGPPSGYRDDGNGGFAIIGGGPADPYRPGGAYDPNKPPTATTPPARIPAAAAAAVQENLKTLHALDDAMGSTAARPQSIGPGTGALGDTFTQYHDPNGTGTRASIGAVGAYKIHDLSGAAVSASEAPRFSPFVPTPQDRPEVARAKLTKFREALQAQIQEQLDFYGPENGYLPYQSEQTQAFTAAGPELPDQYRHPLDAPNNDNLTRSTNGMKTVDNPELKGVRGEYIRRLASGENPGAIVKFLREAGINDPRILQSAVQQVNHLRKYPNTPIDSFNTSVLDDMDVPLSGTESMLNDAAQSAPGAYLMNAGQAASMNTLDEAAGMMGGNSERARIALGDSQNANPVPSFLGGVSGGVMGALGGEAALGAGGMASGLGRAALADTAYGTGYGAGGAQEGNRVSGAVTGGLTGAAGSLGGNLAMKGIGSAVSPTGGSLADLYSAGVRPTPGQRLVEAGGNKGMAGMVGRAVNATEEGLSSVPIVGSAIRGARQEARDQFQVGAFNQALKEIGDKLPKGVGPGTQAHKYAQEAVNKSYDKAREGLVVAADEELANQIGELSGEVGNLAEPSVKRFETIIQNVVMRRTGEVMDGKAYKQVQSEIGKIIRGIRKSPSGDGELADALTNFQGILDDAARRHSDPAAVELLDKADRAYAKLVRIEDASRGAEAGTFSPTQLNSSVRKNGGRVRSKAFNQGDALMQDYAQQGLSLVDRIPNSGSADRAAVGLVAAGGAGAVAPQSLGVLGIIGALYAPGVRKATTGVMAPRGAKAKAIADAVRKRARITGAVGAGAALSAQKDDDQ